MQRGPTAGKTESAHKKEKTKRATYQILGIPRASRKGFPTFRNAHKGKKEKKPQAVAHSAASGDGTHNTEEKEQVRKSGKERIRTSH